MTTTPEITVSDQVAEGARHGLSLAIRRGDVELALRCLHLVWNHPQSKMWLLWHLPTEVLDNSWYLLPYVKKLVETNPDGSYNAAVGFVRMMATNTKSRDVSCLVRLMMYVRTASIERLVRGFTDTPLPDDLYLKHKEYQALVTSFELGPQAYLDEAGRKLTKFETDAMDYLLERAMGQGLVSQKYLYMSAIVLLNMRGISDTKVQRVVAEVKKQPLPAIKPESLPWYCFGPQTTIAEGALASLTGENGRIEIGKVQATPIDVQSLWIIHEDETAVIEEGDPTKAKNTCFETIWWKPLRESAGCIGKLSLEESVQVWQAVRPRLEAAITQTLSKEVF